MSVEGDEWGKLSRKGNGLVERVGVKWLSEEKWRRNGIEGCEEDIVIRIMLMKGKEGGMEVGEKNKRERIIRIKLINDEWKEKERREKIGNLNEEINEDGEEERKKEWKIIEIEEIIERRKKILEKVGKCEGKIMKKCRERIMNVIEGDGNGVEIRNLMRSIGDDVRNDKNGGLRRIDIGVEENEIIENVVMNGEGKMWEGKEMLLEREDEIGKDRDKRKVNGNGKGNILKRNEIEKDFNVIEGVDRKEGIEEIELKERVIDVIEEVGG